MLLLWPGIHMVIGPLYSAGRVRFWRKDRSARTCAALGAPVLDVRLDSAVVQPFTREKPQHEGVILAGFPGVQST